MKWFGVRGLLAGFVFAPFREQTKYSGSRHPSGPLCCCKYSENKWNTEYGKREKYVSYILLQIYWLKSTVGKMLPC